MTTPSTLPTLGTGIPVALGQIDREIKKLWEQSGSVASRASLINLAVYCEGEEAMSRVTRVIGQITEDHACRAILICAEPEKPDSNVQAWISAHCHMSRAGAKQVCCEQITFLLEGPSRNLIPNIVFSHLDSDLPLYLWWQGEFPEPIDSQLWSWVDRLIYDSNDWRDRLAQLNLLRGSLAKAQGRIILCDLNWTRGLYLRQAISSTFDAPEHLPFLSQLEEVTITHAPGFRFTAQLLVGWLASRLNWKETAGEPAAFTTAEGTRVTILFKEQAGAPIGECVIKATGATFRFSREEKSDFLHADIEFADGRKFGGLLPAGKDGSAELVNEELVRGGRNLVYLKAVAVAERLF